MGAFFLLIFYSLLTPRPVGREDGRSDEAISTDTNTYYVLQYQLIITVDQTSSISPTNLVYKST